MGGRTMALLLLALIVVVGGCGGGGGHAPPAKTTISGKVCDATDTSAPIEGAHVYLTGTGRARPAAAQAVLAEDYTDANGNYTLSGSFSGQVEIHVDPVGGFAWIVIQIEVTGQATITIQITLLPTSLSVSEVLIDPPGPLVLDPGQQQQFTATVLDGGGSPLPGVTPTWAVSGNIGTISATGLLTAGNSPSTGHVVAVVSDKADVVQVTVGAPSDEETLRAVIDDMMDALNARDLDRFMSHVSEDVLEGGQTKDDLAAVLQTLLDRAPDISFSAEVPSVRLDSPDLAMVELIVSEAYTGPWGQDRHERTFMPWVFRKESGLWLLYGDHSKCAPRCAVAFWDYWSQNWQGTELQLELRVASSPHYPISAVACSGPLIQGGNLSLNYDAEDDEWQAGDHGYHEISTVPAVGAVYTFDVQYQDGSSEQIQRQIRSTPPAVAPTITAPSGYTVTPTGGWVTVSWEYDTSLMADPSHFDLEFWHDVHPFLLGGGLPLAARTFTFPATEMVDGSSYRLDVLIEDIYGNKSECVRWVTYDAQ